MPPEGDAGAGTAKAGTGSGGTPNSGQQQGQRPYGGTDPAADKGKDTTTAGAGAAGAGQGGAADDGSGGADDQQGKPPDPAAEVKEALRKEREAHKATKGQLRELQPTAEKDSQDLERLRAAEPGWQAERGRLLLEIETLKHATKLGFNDPGDAATLLAGSTHLQRDDEGKPTNVEAALKALLKDKPYLATAGGGGAPADGGNGARGTGGGSGFDMSREIRRAAGKN